MEKMDPLKMYFILNLGIFYCYVSLPEDKFFLVITSFLHAINFQHPSPQLSLASCPSAGLQTTGWNTAVEFGRNTSHLNAFQTLQSQLCCFFVLLAYSHTPILQKKEWNGKQRENRDIQTRWEWTFLNGFAKLHDLQNICVLRMDR